MKKISFVGNSHLGTIAPMLTKDYVNHSVGRVEHFVSRTYGTVRMAIVGKESAETVGEILLEEEARYGWVLDARTTSATVVVGMRFSLVQMVDLWRHYQPDWAAEDHGVPWLSEAMWNAYVDAAFDDTQLWRLVLSLQRAGTDHIWVIPQPHPASWVVDRDGERFDLFGNLFRSGDWSQVLADWERQVYRLERLGVKVFQQPAETLAKPGFTLNSFAMGDPTDASDNSFYARGDFYHMNAEYARTVVPLIYRWIAEAAC